MSSDTYSYSDSDSENWDSSDIESLSSYDESDDNNMCDGCNKHEGTLNNQLYLCDICRKPESKKLMTKTDSLDYYMLTGKDIEQLKCAKTKNPWHKKMDMYLYLKKDCEEVAVQKHGSLEELKEKRDKRNIRRKEANIKREKDMVFRRKELAKHLLSVGIALRNDSRLCEMYIEKGDDCGYTKEDIGKILSEMEFYCNQTEYKQILNNMRDDVINDYGGYRSYKKEHTDEDEEELRNEAKKEAIKRYIKKQGSKLDKMDGIPNSLIPVVEQAQKDK
jgi:hypothetical protein